MNYLEVAQAYFNAWNHRDSKALVKEFADGGTYSDPISGKITGQAIASYAEGLWAAFPDLSFEIVSAGETGHGSVAAQWVMRGTNKGSFGGLPPTGRGVVLPGADFIELGDNGIRSVQGYFDSRAVPDQLGLQVIVQPHAIGPFSFGTSVAVQSGKRTKPGAFGITELRASSAQDAQRVSEYSRRIAAELTETPGFIGWLGVTVGERMMTITAWENAEDSQLLLSGGTHKEAMDHFMKGELGKGGITSVWIPGHINARLVRCTACLRMANYDQSQGKCRCGQTLPEPQPYW